MVDWRLSSWREKASSRLTGGCVIGVRHVLYKLEKLPSLALLIGCKLA